RIVREFPAQVILMGGPSDQEDAQMVARRTTVAMLGKNLFDLTGKFPDLRTFMAMASECALFVGNDSGPGHIAAALGVPFVCTFSGTNHPAEWGPRGERVVLIRKKIDCEGCGLTLCDHHSCMAGLDADPVYQAVKKCVLA
ncbi:MAG: glycosyltransferase family 9 protein, partial [bacterium]|nr:glycosyltransferase family 9 protein [bacterium]